MENKYYTPEIEELFKTCQFPRFFAIIFFVNKKKTYLFYIYSL